MNANFCQSLCHGCICARCVWNGTTKCLIPRHGGCGHCGCKPSDKHPIWRCNGHRGTK